MIAACGRALTHSVSQVHVDDRRGNHVHALVRHCRAPFGTHRRRGGGRHRHPPGLARQRRPGRPEITGPSGETGPSVEPWLAAGRDGDGLRGPRRQRPRIRQPRWTAATVNTVSVPTKLLARGQQYMQVRAKDSADAWSDWTSAGFVVAHCAGPALTGPVAGASLAQPADPPLLTWAPVAGAISYTVEIDNETGFVSPSTTPPRRRRSSSPTTSRPASSTSGGSAPTSATATRRTTPKSVPTPCCRSPAPDRQPCQRPGPHRRRARLDAGRRREVLRARGRRRRQLRLADRRAVGARTGSTAPRSPRRRRSATVSTTGGSAPATSTTTRPSGFACRRESSSPSSTACGATSPAASTPTRSRARSSTASNDLYYEWTPVPHASNYEVWLEHRPQLHRRPAGAAKVTCEVHGRRHDVHAGRGRPDSRPLHAGRRGHRSSTGRSDRWTARTGRSASEGIFSDTQRFMYTDEDA